MFYALYSNFILITYFILVLHQIGKGAFGETYACRDLQTNQDVAVKVEPLNQKKVVLKLEVIALKKLQPCSHVVRYIHSGREDEYNFLIMEKLGANLADLRKKAPGQMFSMCTSLKLILQMIDSLEEVHNHSHLHRDVKPSNFVIGLNGKKHFLYIIDFGLARKYRLPNGEIRPPRKHAGFRGTARYASINSHKCRDLGRRDDLWSVFYVLVEFTLGVLPWRKLKSKEQIGEVKEKCTNIDLVKDLPDEFRLFMEHLQTLGYTDEPNYQYIRDLLTRVMTREGYSFDTPFDWELEDHQRTQLFDPKLREINHLHRDSREIESEDPNLFQKDEKDHLILDGKLKGSLQPYSNDYSRMLANDIEQQDNDSPIEIRSIEKIDQSGIVPHVQENDKTENRQSCCKCIVM